MFALADVTLQRIFDKRRGFWIYIAKTSAFSLAVAIALIGSALLSGLATSRPLTFAPFSTRVLDTLIVPPLLENIIFVGFVEFFLTLEFKRRTIVITVALLSACVHGLVAEWRAVSGLILFGTMAYSYLLWYESRFAKRFFITVIQHFLFNAPALLLLLMSEALD